MTPVELAIRGHLARAEYQLAATLVLNAYRAELERYLRFRVGPGADAVAEVFSAFSEDLWRGLPHFRAESSARTWCFKLAQNAAHRYLIKARRRRRRELLHSTLSGLTGAVHKPRTATASTLGGASKSAVRSLRLRLSQADQDLLVLRVNHGLAWEDIARVLDRDQRLDSEALIKREAARLRKRYQLATGRLKAWMAELKTPVGPK